MTPAINRVSLGMAFFALTISNGAAQEKCRLAWEVPASDTKYTQQFALDVGDIPGHQIRIYELHRVYPNDKPNCEGLRGSRVGVMAIPIMSTVTVLTMYTW